MFFRRFRVPALFLANPWVMALMANGNLTGLVVHVSDTAASVAPIVNVRTVDEAVRSVPIGATELQDKSGRNFLYEVRFFLCVRLVVMCTLIVQFHCHFLYITASLSVSTLLFIRPW